MLNYKEKEINTLSFCTSKNQIKKIMLIIPPNIVLKDTIRRIGEPLGVIMIATYLREKGYNVFIYDMTIEGYDNCVVKGDYVIYGSSEEDLMKQLRNFQPDFVGISCMFSSKEDLTLDVAKIVKKYDPHMVISVGGMPPTINPQVFLQSGDISFVIMHDGEVRLEKLLANLNNNRHPSFGLDGIAFYENNELQIIPADKLNHYFSVLPIPDRTLCNMAGYLNIGKPYSPFTQGRKTAHIVASKGCPFDCVFCAAVNFVGRKVHMRSIDKIIAEIESVIENWGIQEIQFMDDNLTINKDFAMELFTKIKPLNIKWCTPNGLFFNSIDDELLEVMKDSGCYQITLAIESGSQRVLKEVVRKNVNLDHVKHIVDKAHNLGMWVHGLFVVGLIGETREDINKTLEFPFKNNFDSMSISIANAFTGSRLYSMCQDRGYIIDNPKSVNYKHTNFIIPKTSSDYIMDSDELARLVDETTQRFFEWSKENFSEINKQKYDVFIDKAEEDSNKISHRI